MSAWDEIVTWLETAVHQQRPPSSEGLQTLCERAIAERSIDSELRAAEIARWLPGLVSGYRAVRSSAPADDDADLAELLRIVTRWLHPARPRGIATE